MSSFKTTICGSCHVVRIPTTTNKKTPKPNFISFSFLFPYPFLPLSLLIPLSPSPSLERNGTPHQQSLAATKDVQ